MTSTRPRDSLPQYLSSQRYRTNCLTDHSPGVQARQRTRGKVAMDRPRHPSRPPPRTTIQLTGVCLCCVRECKIGREIDTRTLSIANDRCHLKGLPSSSWIPLVGARCVCYPLDNYLYDESPYETKSNQHQHHLTGATNLWRQIIVQQPTKYDDSSG